MLIFFTVNRNYNIPNNFRELETTIDYLHLSSNYSYILTFIFITFILYVESNASYEYDEEESEEEREALVINTFQSFKSDECVICLTNSPNILFCNCGHIAICVECDKVKSLKNCPVCKTKNTIKRTIEY